MSLATQTKQPAHKAFQASMIEAIKIAGLPNGAPEKSIIRKLVEIGAVADAVDMLFGISPEEAKRNMKENHWRLYLALREGKLRDLLKGIIEHHHWHKGSFEKVEYAIRVYPGEDLVVEYPVCQEVKRVITDW